MTYDKYEILFEIRHKVNQEREKIRAKGLIGNNNESLAIIEYHGGINASPLDVASLLLDEQTVSAWINGEVLLNIIHPKCDDTMPIKYDVIVTSIREDESYPVCPRCRKPHKTLDQPDNLCVRCFKVLEQAWPEYLPKSV